MKKKYKIPQYLTQAKNKTENASCVTKGVWSTNKKTLSSCEANEVPNISVVLSPLAYLKTLTLLAKYPKLEWLAYLIGKKVKDTYQLQDLLIPKQVQSTATVDLDPTETLDLHNVVGTIHSHHTMGAFFSTTDTNSIVPNHPVSIVVSTTGWACQVKQTLPCGHYLATSADLLMEQTASTDLVAFDTEVGEKMKEKPITQRQPSFVPGAAHSLDCTPGVWQGFTCLSCKRVSYEYKNFVWHNGGSYCQTCSDLIGNQSSEDWVLLNQQLRENQISKKQLKKLKNRQLPLQKEVVCDFCRVPTPADTIKDYLSNQICPECYADCNSEKFDTATLQKLLA